MFLNCSHCNNKGRKDPSSHTHHPPIQKVKANHTKQNYPPPPPNLMRQKLVIKKKNEKFNLTSARCEWYNFAGSLINSQWDLEYKRKSSYHSWSAEGTEKGYKSCTVTIQRRNQPDVIMKAQPLTTTNTCNRVTSHGSHPRPKLGDAFWPESKTVNQKANPTKHEIETNNFFSKPKKSWKFYF